MVRGVVGVVGDEKSITITTHGHGLGGRLTTTGTSKMPLFVVDTSCDVLRTQSADPLSALFPHTCASMSVLAGKPAPVTLTEEPTVATFGVTLMTGVCAAPASRAGVVTRTPDTTAAAKRRRVHRGPRPPLSFGRILTAHTSFHLPTPAWDRSSRPRLSPRPR